MIDYQDNTDDLHIIITNNNKFACKEPTYIRGVTIIAQDHKWHVTSPSETALYCKLCKVKHRTYAVITQKAEFRFIFFT